MLQRFVGGLLVAGPILLCGTAVSQAQDPELAPDCVEYSANQGKLDAVDKCSPTGPHGRYFKTDIDRCKYIGRSESWMTVDNKLYVCTPDESGKPATGSA